MIFLIISWVFLIIAAIIGFRHLKRYHTARKRQIISQKYYSEFTEQQQMLMYDWEREHERAREQAL